MTSPSTFISTTVPRYRTRSLYKSIIVSRIMLLSLMSFAVPSLTIGAFARSHKTNMQEMCKRTREVNAQGLGGEGYFYWFFNKHQLAPPSAVPSFWAEVKVHCPGAW